MTVGGPAWIWPLVPEDLEQKLNNILQHIGTHHPYTHNGVIGVSMQFDEERGEWMWPSIHVASSFEPRATKIHWLDILDLHEMDAALRSVVRAMIAANMYGPYMNKIEESLVMVHPSGRHPTVSIKGDGPKVYIESTFFDEVVDCRLFRKDFLDAIAMSGPNHMTALTYSIGPIGGGKWGVKFLTKAVPLLGNCTIAGRLIGLLLANIPTVNFTLIFCGLDMNLTCC